MLGLKNKSRKCWLSFKRIRGTLRYRPTFFILLRIPIMLTRRFSRRISNSVHRLLIGFSGVMARIRARLLSWLSLRILRQDETSRLTRPFTLSWFPFKLSYSVVRFPGSSVGRAGDCKRRLAAPTGNGWVTQRVNSGNSVEVPADNPEPSLPVIARPEGPKQSRFWREGAETRHSPPKGADFVIASEAKQSRFSPRVKG